MDEATFEAIDDFCAETGAEDALVIEILDEYGVTEFDREGILEMTLEDYGAADTVVPWEEALLKCLKAEGYTD
jgi:hypothetical protein